MAAIATAVTTCAGKGMLYNATGDSDGCVSVMINVSSFATFLNLTAPPANYTCGPTNASQGQAGAPTIITTPYGQGAYLCNGMSRNPLPLALAATVAAATRNPFPGLRTTSAHRGGSSVTEETKTKAGIQITAIRSTSKAERVHEACGLEPCFWRLSRRSASPRPMPLAANPRGTLHFSVRPSPFRIPG